jgi:adhesin/invasin
MRHRVILHRQLSVAIALSVLAACGETGPSEQLPPAAVTNVTGIPLVGTAGETLPERVVIRVEDAAGNPLPGVSVTFAVSATGAVVNPATTITDGQGEARTRWTLGSTPGQQTLTVTAGGSASLQITALAGAPRIASLAVNAGNNQVGTSGSALAVNPSVIARDAAGNPVQGVTVTFSVMTGGGTVAQPSSVTNAQGIASSGAWTLGGAAGTHLLSAQVPQPGVANNPLVFSATAASGAPATVFAFSLVQQSASVGALVSSPPSVVVRDNSGNGVPNVNVTFTVTSGGGQVQGATQATNAQGVATVTSWRLGNTTGPNTMTATVTGLAPVTFTATATAGAPAQLQKTAGDNQTAQVNKPVAIAPQVRVMDAAGNGVSGVTVDFSVASGGGTVVVSRVITASDGRASVGAWILGPTPGPNTLTASVTGLTSVTFDAVATGGPAVSMQPVSLVTQSGTAGQAAGSPPSVVVRDAQGNPVAGVTVTFAVTLGGGTLAGASQITGATGIATVGSWTFGAIAGANTVVASSTGLPSVTFNATTVGVPTQMVAFAGNNQAAIAGTQVLTKPAVRVTDANGVGTAGVTVTFQVTSGGGSLTSGIQTTDATGLATVGSWTLGAGTSNTMTASVTLGGVTGNPVLFTASAATHIAITQQPPANSPLGANFTVTVQLRDAANALSPVNGAPLTISITTGGGTLNAGTTPLTVNTTAGVATFNVNITSATGARTLTISGAGVGSVVTTTINLP